MTTTALSDAELLAQARGGDEAAFTELYVRHQAAARRLASAYPRAGDPDDLVNGAFERILGALRRGGGPDEAFRAYLFVTLRRLAADLITRSHDEPVDEVPEPVRAEAHSPQLDPADRQLVVSAYESLAEKWQAVLWQTAVEGRQPRELAGVLGMSANAAAALAYRAREKLRQAYLQAHLQAAPRPQCEPFRSRLGAYVRDGLSQRDRGTTEEHLDDCGACRSLVAELVDVNRMLVRSLFPFFQATAAQVGAATAAGGAVTGGVLMGRKLISKARSNPTVVAGIVAIAALAIAMISMRGGPENLPDLAEKPEEVTPTTSPQVTPPPPDEPVVEVPTALVRPTTTTTTAPPDETTTTTAPPPPALSPLTPTLPLPITTTTTSTSPPTTTRPRERPGLIVVWVRAGAELRITLTNNTGEPTDGLYLEVDVSGAVVNGAPNGCVVGLGLIWSASCSLHPLDTGEVVEVTVPIQILAPDDASATTHVCESGLLNLNCVGKILGRVTTQLLG
jgi:RNA polymerase sigma factor (sigma-70 family)